MDEFSIAQGHVKFTAIFIMFCLLSLCHTDSIFNFVSGISNTGNPHLGVNMRGYFTSMAQSRIPIKTFPNHYSDNNTTPVTVQVLQNMPLQRHDGRIGGTIHLHLTEQMGWRLQADFLKKVVTTWEVRRVSESSKQNQAIHPVYCIFVEI